MKKLLLSLSLVAAASASIVTVTSCSEDNTEKKTAKPLVPLMCATTPTVDGSQTAIKHGGFVSGVLSPEKPHEVVPSHEGPAQQPPKPKPKKDVYAIPAITEETFASDISLAMHFANKNLLPGFKGRFKLTTETINPGLIGLLAYEAVMDKSTVYKDAMASGEQAKINKYKPYMNLRKIFDVIIKDELKAAFGDKVKQADAINFVAMMVQVQIAQVRNEGLKTKMTGRLMSIETLRATLEDVTDMDFMNIVRNKKLHTEHAVAEGSEKGAIMGAFSQLAGMSNSPAKLDTAGLKTALGAVFGTDASLSDLINILWFSEIDRNQARKSNVAPQQSVTAVIKETPPAVKDGEILAGVTEASFASDASLAVFVAIANPTLYAEFKAKFHTGDKFVSKGLLGLLAFEAVLDQSLVYKAGLASDDQAVVDKFKQFSYLRKIYDGIIQKELRDTFGHGIDQYEAVKFIATFIQAHINLIKNPRQVKGFAKSYVSLQTLTNMFSHISVARYMKVANGKGMQILKGTTPDKVAAVLAAFKDLEASSKTPARPYAVPLSDALKAIFGTNMKFTDMLANLWFAEVDYNLLPAAQAPQPQPEHQVPPKPEHHDAKGNLVPQLPTK